MSQKLQKITYELLAKGELFNENIDLVQETYINEFYKIIELCFQLSVTNENLEKFQKLGNIEDVKSVFNFIASVTENDRSYAILNFFMLRFIQSCMKDQEKEYFIASLCQKYDFSEFEINQVKASYEASKYLGTKIK